MHAGRSPGIPPCADKAPAAGDASANAGSASLKAPAAAGAIGGWARPSAAPACTCAFTPPLARPTQPSVVAIGWRTGSAIQPGTGTGRPEAEGAAAAAPCSRRPSLALALAPACAPCSSMPVCQLLPLPTALSPAIRKSGSLHASGGHCCASSHTQCPTSPSLIETNKAAPISFWGGSRWRGCTSSRLYLG